MFGIAPGRGEDGEKTWDRSNSRGANLGVASKGHGMVVQTITRIAHGKVDGGRGGFLHTVEQDVPALAMAPSYPAKTHILSASTAEQENTRISAPHPTATKQVHLQGQGREGTMVIPLQLKRSPYLAVIQQLDAFLKRFHKCDERFFVAVLADFANFVVESASCTEQRGKFAKVRLHGIRKEV
jgi:hypothetical protein